MEEMHQELVNEAWFGWCARKALLRALCVTSFERVHLTALEIVVGAALDRRYAPHADVATQPVCAATQTSADDEILRRFHDEMHDPIAKEAGPPDRPNSRRFVRRSSAAVRATGRCGQVELPSGRRLVTARYCYGSAWY